MREREEFALSICRIIKGFCVYHEYCDRSRWNGIIKGLAVPAAPSGEIVGVRQWWNMDRDYGGGIVRGDAAAGGGFPIYAHR